MTKTPEQRKLRMQEYYKTHKEVYAGYRKKFSENHPGYIQNKKEIRKANGLCYICGKNKSVEGVMACEICRAKYNNRPRVKKVQPDVGITQPSQ